MMMKKNILAGMILATMGTALLASEMQSPAEEMLVSSADFAILAGDSWSGSLSYLDYSSNTEQRIPVEIRFDNPGSHKVVYHIKYPGEAQYNATEKLKWSRNGRKLDGEAIVNRSHDAEGTTILVTQFEGEDDNRPAEIRMTYSLNESVLAISKEVRFEEEADFFRRNAYELVR